MKEELFIDRWENPDCVVGRLRFGKFRCFTLELPNLNNQVNISCIPDGRYEVFKRFSPGKREWIIEYLYVPGRTYIQMHSASFTSQLLGCQAIGDGLKFINDDNVIDVTNSKATFNKLMLKVPERFFVNIKGLNSDR